ncbi:MAG: DUF3347 domain-containing protein [Planctomycetota bacterium]
MAFENRGARWLQAEDGVLNPYFGARMLTCGEVTERFPPRADPAAAGFAAELAPLVRVYLELAEELAQDAATGQARAAELRAALDAVDAQSLSAQARATWEDERLPALHGALEALAAASDLAAQRAAFEALSQALIQVVTAHGAPPGVEVRRFHCPMAFGHGADWLQTAADTRNPFYGSRMFDCGSEVELGGPR